MAVYQAHHVLREMVDILKKNEVKVSYAIHVLALNIWEKRLYSERFTMIY